MSIIHTHTTPQQLRPKKHLCCDTALYPVCYNPSYTPILPAEHTQQRSGLSGVLLVLPPYYGSKALSTEDASQLLLLERQLLQKSAAVPVFFARETPELAAAVSDHYPSTAGTAERRG